MAENLKNEKATKKTMVWYGLTELVTEQIQMRQFGLRGR